MTPEELSEMRETRGWLRFVVIAELLPEKRIQALVQESDELAKILGKSSVTARKRFRHPNETQEGGAM